MNIAVIGGYGVGQVFRVYAFPDPGESISATSFDVMHGGKGSNQAVAASRLGAAVTLLSAIGADEWADRALSLWRENGIDHRCVRRAAAPTMIGAIIVDDGGENRIVIARGALDELDVSDAESFRAEIARADLLVTSLEVPVGVVTHAVRIAREEGTPVLLNPAPAPTPFPSALLDVDFLTPNLTEAALMTGLNADSTPPERILARLRLLSPARIAMTLGSDGVLVSGIDESAVQVAAVPPRRVVDTTGAGDSFTAALAVAIASGEAFVEAVEWAAAAGSHAVATAGVIPALPFREDLPPLPGRRNRQPRPSAERKNL